MVPCMPRLICRALLVVVAVNICTPVIAGTLEDAQAAFASGDYGTALKLYLPLAEEGHAGAQYNVGAIYLEFEKLGVAGANHAYTVACHGCLRWLRQAGALLCVVIQFSVWSHEELRLGRIPLTTKSCHSLLIQHIQICDLSVEVDRSCAAHRLVNMTLRSFEKGRENLRTAASYGDPAWEFHSVGFHLRQVTVLPIKALIVNPADYRWSAPKILEYERNLLVADPALLEGGVALPEQFIINKHISALDISKKIGGLLSGIRLSYSNNDETKCNNNEQEIEERNRVWKDYLQERLIFYIVCFCIGLLLAWSASLFG